MKNRRFPAFLITLVLVCSLTLSAQPQGQVPQTSDEQRILGIMHSISSITLFDYEKELCSEKYGGRLTGTPEFNAAADWVSSLLKKWGVVQAAVYKLLC